MISYLAVKCRKLDACLAFYTDLGFTFEPETHPNVPLHFAAEREGLVLELHGEAARGADTGDGTRIGFRVQDVAGTVRAMAEAGWVVQQEARSGPWGVRAVLVDPDERRVELSGSAS